MYKHVQQLNQAGILTEGESITLNCIMEQLSTWEPESEPTFSALSPEDLPSMTGMRIGSIAGYVGSLVKKQYIEVHKVDSSGTNVWIIYITPKTRNLYYSDYPCSNALWQACMSEALDLKLGNFNPELDAVDGAPGKCTISDIIFKLQHEMDLVNEKEVELDIATARVVKPKYKWFLKKWEPLKSE